MDRARKRWFLVVVLSTAAACVATQTLSRRSSALEYLYPEGRKEATPAIDVRLEVPVRVGLAFAPNRVPGIDSFTEVQKQGLLSGMADTFREKDFIATLEVLPSHYLTPGGGFEELDRLRSAFGIDLIALVSYDQTQFTETTNASWTYLTVVGAFAVRGEKNETRTLMDVVVYDIPSRALLFRASGESTVQASSTPVKAQRKLRLESEEGFDLATDDLVAHVAVALDAFREQVATGTVRGPGTPAVEVTRAATAPGDATGGHAGSLGLAELVLVVAAVLWGVAGRRKRTTGSAW